MSNLVNTPAPNTPYFTPAQIPPAGTAAEPTLDGKTLPRLFQPIKIRGVEFHNRVFVSPMCQYSSKNGELTPWHMAHLGGILIRGPGLTIVEATAVLPEGRITPEDSGLWSDAQIGPLRSIVDFAHSQGQKIGIQLAHAGRKASTVAPWLSQRATASHENDGWADNIWAPSAIPFIETLPVPKELTREGIDKLKHAFADAAKRAVEAGIDMIEIHNAHGYLLHEFLSPVSNKRTDEYGGPFENRVRLTLEIVDAVRKEIPEDMPLFLRISMTDCLEESLPDEPSWRIEDTVRFAPLLSAHGVDLLDLSAAGSHPAQRITPKLFSQRAQVAREVKEAVTKSKSNSKIVVSAVGGITDGVAAEELLKDGSIDVVFVGRQFQKDPRSVWTFAEQLGVTIKLANQIAWGLRSSIPIPAMKSKVAKETD